MGYTISKEATTKMSRIFTERMIGKVVIGAHYTMMSAEDTDLDRHITIRDELNKCGIPADKVCKIISVGDAYIFEFEPKIISEMAVQIYNATVNTDTEEAYTTADKKAVEIAIEKRKSGDLIGLGKFLKTAYEARKDEVEVVLYSLSATDRITYQAAAINGESVSLRYKAYALTLDDISRVNSEIIIPAGFRVKKVNVLEMLPNYNGVRVDLYLEGV